MPTEAKGKAWWQVHLFKHHEKKPEAQASPAPSPSPAHRHHARSTAATAEAGASPSPQATPPPETMEKPAKPSPTPEEPKPAAEATPAPKEKHKTSGMTSQVPFVPGGPPEQQEAPLVETKSPVEEEAEESSRFQAAKAKALQDTRVRELQAKADGATGDDAKAASRRYYRALYEKMREIDPTVKDRIDRTEAATMRRVEQEQPQ